MHVWVDEGGLVRQVARVDRGHAGDDGHVVTTERFYDFGTPVDIQLPAESQVTDISAGRLGRRMMDVALKIWRFDP